MYYLNENDENLVMYTLAGEQKAYEVLVSRYRKTAVAAALSVTKNSFMAEDAVQDAFVTAWMKLNTLQDPKKYGAWVSRIAKNCAINMINRYKNYLPIETEDNVDLTADTASNPEELFEISEDRDDVNKSIKSLPDRTRQIIYLHYYDGLSVADIADRMNISEGTVKWQLHDGRKRLRKELSAMNEKYSDTLVQRVMKKVEELKLWQIKNNKNDFEKIYKDVLKDIEELPESTQKQHALADVMMRGWWWLNGKKNDALFERITNAAIEGKNEDVMRFIVTTEDTKVYGEARIDLMRNKQIPRLEKAGFVKTLGREWFWLGFFLFRRGKADEGYSAYDKVEEILDRNEAYRILVPYAKKMEKIIETAYKNKMTLDYFVGASTEEYRYINGKIKFWRNESFGEGEARSINSDLLYVLRNLSASDDILFADISVGETFEGADGTTLTFVSDDISVQTPIGKFENCQLWETQMWNDIGKIKSKSYYKDGVGIVKYTCKSDGVEESILLKNYIIKSGSGILPFGEGNTWEYASEYDSEIIDFDLKYTVEYANNEKFIISTWKNIDRKKYDENSWTEMMDKIVNNYFKYDSNGNSHINDVSYEIKQAEKLAVTPMQKAHTKVAASVIRRIMDTDPTLNPNNTATGHWNFFNMMLIKKEEDTLKPSMSLRWHFEWKNFEQTDLAERPLLFNNILENLRYMTNNIWSDEWQIGTSPIVEYIIGAHNIKTQIVCEDGGTVKTKAGTFKNCLKLCLNSEGFEDLIFYITGKKVYYFAEGIGIVKTENEYFNGAKIAVYELTEYEGTGKGYMPMADGLFRRYEAVGLTDGFVGGAEYTYVEDEDGDIVIFSNQIGMKEKLPPITQYSSIQGEIIEEKLWEEGKWQEGHMKYAENNLHLFLHMIARPSRNRMNAKRSIEINGFYMNMMENFGQNGEVPPAWYGLYSRTALIRSAALFGDGRKEDGYDALDIAVRYCEMNSMFKPGDLLETGNEEMFCGIKYEYGKGFIILGDGSKEPISYDYHLRFNTSDLLYHLTCEHGWEWFNSVREEERFIEYIHRVQNSIKKTPNR